MLNQNNWDLLYKQPGRKRYGFKAKKSANLRWQTFERQIETVIK